MASFADDRVFLTLILTGIDVDPASTGGINDGETVMKMLSAVERTVNSVEAKRPLFVLISNG